MWQTEILITIFLVVDQGERWAYDNAFSPTFVVHSKEFNYIILK